MILSSNLEGSIQFFGNRSKFGLTASVKSSSLLSLSALSLEDLLTANAYTSNMIKFVKLFVSEPKYKCEELDVLIEFIIGKQRKFVNNKSYEVKLWEGKELSVADIARLKTINLTETQKELMKLVFKDVFINESLSTGLVLDETEINFEESGDAGDGETDPTDPTAVSEDFHYNGGDLMYAGVKKGGGGFATLVGYSDAAFDTVELATKNPVALTCAAFTPVSSAFVMNVGVKWTWGSTTAKLFGWSVLGKRAPGAGSVYTEQAVEFLLYGKFGVGDARKILLEFSTPAMDDFVELKHIPHASGIGGVVSRVSVQNPYTYRWLADNLLEININRGLVVTGAVDYPASDIVASAPGVGLLTTQPRFAGTVAGMSESVLGASPYTRTVNMNGGRLLRSRVTPTLPYSVTQLASGGAIPVESDQYPVGFDTIAQNVGNLHLSGGYVTKGLLLSASAVTALLGGLDSTSANPLISLKFDSLHTLVSVSCAKAMLGSPAGLS